MFIVSVPTMAANYLASPEIAVDDFRALVAAAWLWEQHREAASLREEEEPVPQELPSLDSIIAGNASVCESSSNATLPRVHSRELDFRSLIQISLVDSIRRFALAIACCHDIPEGTIFSIIDQSILNQLQQQMVDCTDDHVSVRMILMEAQTNLDRFANAVELSRRIKKAGENVISMGEQIEADDGPDEPEVLTKDSPEAASFMDLGKWCTAAYAADRYGIGGSQLTRASQNSRGFRVSQQPPIFIKVSRRKAQTDSAAGSLRYVYHSGELRNLADALNQKREK